MPAKTATKSSPPDLLAISARAYAIWMSEGRPHGRDLEHWLRAEAELAPKPAARKPRAKAAAA